MTLKKFFYVLFAISLIFSSCKVSKENTATTTSFATEILKYTTVPEITENDIRWHISVLASDSMQGRATSTPYEAKAAEYIKEQFQFLGLKAFDDNYLQSITCYSHRNVSGYGIIDVDEVMSQNVVGYLETADSENENGYIVIGAHYDHVGTKKNDDSVEIYNGADDNASGVAGILEIAEKLKAGEKLKYNVIFAAFGAEEMGLVGSREFCNNPPVPLEKIKLMINLDMIGRMDSDNHVFINTAEDTNLFSPLIDEIKKLHPDLNVDFALDSYLQGSDHTSFFNKKIPAIFFTTGTHKDYHKSTDTPDSINYQGTKQLLDFVYDFVISPAMDSCIRSLTSSDVSP